MSRGEKHRDENHFFSIFCSDTMRMAFIKNRMAAAKYRRVLLKISGEALADRTGRGIDFAVVNDLVSDIRSAHKLGVEVAIVLGGGNFWRFRDHENSGLPRVASDQVGMIATLLNIMALSNTLNSNGVPAHMYSAFLVDSIIPKYQVFDARRSLETKKVVLLGGGTGNPYFTTDTAAALRALELDVDILLKATKVDGVYDSDPMKNKNAKKFSSITFDEAIEKNLKVMDQTAFSLLSQGCVPVMVFDGLKKGNILKAVKGEAIGTIVRN